MRRRPVRRARLRRSVSAYLFVAPAALYLGGLLAYPIVFNVLTSFQNLTTATLAHGGAPWVGLANYAAAIADPLFLTAVMNSVVFTAASVALHLVVGLGLALFFQRGFPGSRSMRSLFLVSYAIPVVAAAEVFRWLLDGQSGLVNYLLSSVHALSGPVYWLADPSLAMPSVIAVNAWLGMPFTMVALTAGLAGIPRELHEAAEIDGAGPWQRFRRITWPLLRPSFLAVTVLGVIFTFKLFDLIWITTQGGPANATDVLPTIAYRLVFTEFQFGKGAAILNIVFLALFALSVAYVLILRRGEDAA